MSNLLHIYSQCYSHGEAWVCGDREALTALRGALDRVLTGPDRAAAMTSFTNDGEGYTTFVVLTEDTTISLPYAISEHANHGTHPFDLVGRKRYRELLGLPPKEPK